MTVATERYSCDEANAAQIADWLRTRGGIVIWESVNLSNLGQSWTGPYLDKNGIPATKPNWQCSNTPARHIIDIAEVDVTTAKEYKRFHVAVRRGSQGLGYKVTDAGSEKIRREVDKAQEKTKKRAWYEFDYGATEFDPLGKNCVIMIEDVRVPMIEWQQKQKA